MQDTSKGYDTIIVGAGAAGCVLAARLSEDPARRVLLLEAGPPPTEAVHDPARWTELMHGALDWGYRYAPGPGVNGRSIPIPRGRVIGGSSSTNAMLWYRGHPSDYDAWDVPGWSFADVLPYFRRSEAWSAGADAWRGGDGPMRVGPPPDPHPLALAMLAGAPGLGIPVIADANGCENAGACLADYTIHAGRRWSAADGYLRPAMARPNLTVRTGAQVSGIILDGTRCTGVRTHEYGGIAASEVILCAGAIGSPLLLLRAGIGPAGPVVRLPVGENLQDHPLVMGVNFHARIPLGAVRGNGGGSMMNWCSTTDEPAPDLHAFIVQGTHADAAVRDALMQDAVTPGYFAISPGLMRVESRGWLRLHGDSLEIQPNFLQSSRDVAALMRGVDTCLALGASPAFAGLSLGPAYPATPMDRAETEGFVRANTSTFYHTCGTCRMGSDTEAVVDPALRVHGVDGLRVVDASVIPIIPSCNTQAPVIMIAERAADLIRRLN